MRVRVCTQKRGWVGRKKKRNLPVRSLVVCRRYTSLNPARFQSLNNCPVTPKEVPIQCSLSGGLWPADTSSGGNFFRGLSLSAASPDFLFLSLLVSSAAAEPEGQYCHTEVRAHPTTFSRIECSAFQQTWALTKETLFQCVSLTNGNTSMSERCKTSTSCEDLIWNSQQGSGVNDADQTARLPYQSNGSILLRSRNTLKLGLISPRTSDTQRYALAPHPPKK